MRVTVQPQPGKQGDWKSGQPRLLQSEAYKPRQREALRKMFAKRRSLASGAFRRHTKQRPTDATKSRPAMKKTLPRLLSFAPGEFVSGRSYALLTVSFILLALGALVLLMRLQLVSIDELLGQASPAAGESVAKTRGGWRLPTAETAKSIGSERCNIERRWSNTLSADEFERDYRYRRPVMLRFKKGAEAWTKPVQWTRTSLLRDYGHSEVASGRSETIVRAGGKGDIASSLTEFVSFLMEERDAKEEPMYVRRMRDCSTFADRRTFYLLTD